MRNLNFIALTSIVSFSIAIFAEDCKKCQLVREFNKENPSKYEFYEDYLKDKKEGKAQEIRYEDNINDKKINTLQKKPQKPAILPKIKQSEVNEQLDNNQQRDMLEDIKFEEETGVSY
jgi:hypothetical protein